MRSIHQMEITFKNLNLLIEFDAVLDYDVYEEPFYAINIFKAWYDDNGIDAPYIFAEGEQEYIEQLVSTRFTEQKLGEDNG